MAILVTCAACGVRLRYKGHILGTTTRCKACQAPVKVVGDKVADHDIFASFSSADHTSGEAVVAALESRGMRCWAAPRDILPGKPWDGAALDAIDDAKVMVLVYSASANQSARVIREVDRAVHRGVTIVPVRIDRSFMSPAMEYYIAAAHWLDAMDGPIQSHLGKLIDTVSRLLETEDTRASPRRAAAAPPRMIHRRIMLGGIGLMLLALLSLGFVYWRSRTNPPRHARLHIAVPPATRQIQKPSETEQWVAQLLATARENDSRDKGRDALAALGELLAIDPYNEEALSLRSKIAAYYPLTRPSARSTKATTAPVIKPPAIQAPVERPQTAASPATAQSFTSPLKIAVVSPFFRDRVRAALALNGIDNYLDCGGDDGSGFQLDTATATIELWVRFDRFPDHFAAIAARRNAGPRAPGWMFGYASDFLECRNRMCLVIQAESGAPQVIPAKSWTPVVRQWYHLALVKNGGQVTFVRNGVVDSEAAVAAIPEVKAPLAFGMSGGQYALSGALDDVRLWKLARPAAELRLGMFSQLTRPQDGLAANWRLDESRGTSAADLVNPGWLAHVRGTIPAIQIDKNRMLPGELVSNSIGMRLAYIPAGVLSTLQRPATRRSTTRPVAKPRPPTQPRQGIHFSQFFLGECEVTVGQFSQFVKESGYITQAEKSGGMQIMDPAIGESRYDVKANWRNPGFAQGDKYPVVGVSWIDANEFCAWLSRREKRSYRLPRDLEWEYACRAHRRGHYWWGMDAGGTQAQYANGVDLSYKEKFPVKARCTWRDGFTCTAPVGSFLANSWGLYDMSGNVDEWCADNPGFENNAADNLRALRGGAWTTGDSRFYVKDRIRQKMDYRHNSIGFRVLLESAAEQ